MKSILGDYGNHDFDDLMMGVDYILETHPGSRCGPIIRCRGKLRRIHDELDRNAPDRFRAAVTQRSISNWISFYGTSDIGPFFVEKQLLDDINHTQRLWEMSPVAHAKTRRRHYWSYTDK